MSERNKETVDEPPALPLAPRVDIMAGRNTIHAFEKDWRDIQDMVRDNVRAILMEAPDPRNEEDTAAFSELDTKLDLIDGMLHDCMKLWMAYMEMTKTVAGTIADAPEISPTEPFEPEAASTEPDSSTQE